MMHSEPLVEAANPLRAAAQAYVAGGLSLIPIDRATKRPHFELLPRNEAGKPSWAQFMQRRATRAEVELWVECGAQLAAVAGPISGGLLVLDFDVAGFYDEWLAAVGELAEGLPVQRTGREGGAYQVWLRCPEPGANQELAYALDPAEPTGRRVAIETRGGREVDGVPSCGYAVLAPSLHPSGRRYQVVAGDFACIPTLSQAHADTLLAAARGLCQAPGAQELPERGLRPLPIAASDGVPHSALSTGHSALSPIAAYNASHTIEATLEHYGYTRRGLRYARPGGTNGTVAIRDGRSFHHHADDPLKDGYWKTPFDVFCRFDHGGDAQAAIHCGLRISDCGLKRQSRGLTVGTAVNPQSTIRDPQWSGSPQPLTGGLRPVTPLTPDMLPEALRDCMVDIAQRMACPLEYPAIACIVALSSLVGRKCGIHPKRHDDWIVVPNLWGGLVGAPGVQKTPAAEEALRPLQQLVDEALARHKGVLAEHQAEAMLRKARGKAAAEALDKGARTPGVDDEALRELARQAAQQEDEPTPAPRRHTVNDATVEALGQRLKENPHGVLLYRDEIDGFLRSLDKQGNETARAFFLEAWNGTGQNFIYDRIGRGTTVIPAVCVSVFGTIQPGPLLRYIRAGGEGDGADGLIQRFQLLVYPDSPDWQQIDRPPDARARERAMAVFRALDCGLQIADCGLIGQSRGLPAGTAVNPQSAICNPQSPVSCLRFDEAAQRLFDEWRARLETQKLRGGLESPMMEAHLAKYRSLMPALALLFHLVDVAGTQGGDTPGPVSAAATTMAIAWCDFLEGHARRIYQMAWDNDYEVVGALAARLAGSLPNPFTVRDVIKKGWAGLREYPVVEGALDHLQARGWVQAISTNGSPSGGRPTQVFWIHPEALGAVKPEVSGVLGVLGVD